MDTTKRVSIAEKVTLTVDEAAEYSNIGRDKLYQMINEPGCTFVLFVGERKRLIKRREFERFLEKAVAI